MKLSLILGMILTVGLDANSAEFSPTESFGGIYRPTEECMLETTVTDQARKIDWIEIKFGGVVRVSVTHSNIVPPVLQETHEVNTYFVQPKDPYDYRDYMGMTATDFYSHLAKSGEVENRYEYRGREHSVDQISLDLASDVMTMETRDVGAEDLHSSWGTQLFPFSNLKMEKSKVTPDVLELNEASWYGAKIPFFKDEQQENTYKWEFGGFIWDDTQKPWQLWKGSYAVKYQEVRDVYRKFDLTDSCKLKKVK
jgi:hypothetical protein